MNRLHEDKPGGEVHFRVDYSLEASGKAGPMKSHRNSVRLSAKVGVILSSLREDTVSERTKGDRHRHDKPFSVE